MRQTNDGQFKISKMSVFYTKDCKVYENGTPDIAV
jgi:hypothetical protein